MFIASAAWELVMSNPICGTCFGCWGSAMSGAIRRMSASITTSRAILSRMVESSNLHVRSPWVSSGTHLLVDPGEIGLLAREETGDGVYQHGVGRSGVETAGLFEGQDALHPPIAFVTGRAQRALAPEDATP